MTTILLDCMCQNNTETRQLISDHDFGKFQNSFCQISKKIIHVCHTTSYLTSNMFLYYLVRLETFQL